MPRLWLATRHSRPAPRRRVGSHSLQRPARVQPPIHCSAPDQPLLARPLPTLLLAPQLHHRHRHRRHHRHPLVDSPQPLTASNPHLPHSSHLFCLGSHRSHLISQDLLLRAINLTEPLHTCSKGSHRINRFNKINL